MICYWEGLNVRLPCVYGLMSIVCIYWCNGASAIVEKYDFILVRKVYALSFVSSYLIGWYFSWWALRSGTNGEMWYVHLLLTHFFYFSYVDVIIFWEIVLCCDHQLFNRIIFILLADISCTFCWIDNLFMT